MKIGIITYHSSHNYGSMLQAYALSTFLRNKGYVVEIIDFRSKEQLQLYHYPLCPIVYNLRYFKNFLCSFLNPKWLYQECKKWKYYEQFIKDYLPVTPKRYLRWKDVVNDLKFLKYDIIIAGGDQIWNMQGLHFDNAYYLSGDLPNIRKVSYSTSFGGVFLNKIRPEEQTFIQKALQDFSFISVRETSMKEFLQPLIKTKIFIAADPTLLLCANDYQIIIQDEPLVKGNYIFYYSPFVNTKAERLAVLYGNYMNLKVVTTFPHIRKNRMTAIHESGPKEFLNLLKNATMVVGRSFHLVVFSLLFHKDFVISEGIKDYRINDILSKVGLADRGAVDSLNYKETLSPISSDKIDAFISLQRLESISYLNSALTM